MLNNYFFPDTAYNLIGFHKKVKSLYAVVEQNFVIATQKTDLNHVKLFLENSGFVNKKNNDYFHPELGLISIVFPLLALSERSKIFFTNSGS